MDLPDRGNAADSGVTAETTFQVEFYRLRLAWQWELAEADRASYAPKHVMLPNACADSRIPRLRASTISSSAIGLTFLPGALPPGFHAPDLRVSGVQLLRVHLSTIEHRRTEYRASEVRCQFVEKGCRKPGPGCKARVDTVPAL